MLIGLVLYERLFVLFARQFTGNPSGITCLQRMGVGYVVNILATIVASFRKAEASDHNLLDDPNAIVPITVFWLAPQFCLQGVAEVFMSVGHLEFLYDQSPESMRSTALALYWIAIAMGDYLGTLIVSLVYKYSGMKSNWLPDRNLNRGRLECSYWLVIGFIPLEEVSETCKEEVEELAGNKVPSMILDGRNGHGEVELGLGRNETA
ncbi:protein nrt1/ ptr family 3.1 [Quercus suber]|uniref:Protein nrt1/ ptr family 3.1 n=1 Tax=Quercus suber TaxID=58331 RepID=A0AAW0M4K4_QUESU